MSNPMLTPIYPGGNLINEVTSVTLVNNTAKTVDFTVPSFIRVIIKSIKVTNPDDVDRVVTFNLFLEAGKTNNLAFLQSASVGAGFNPLHWPTLDSGTTLMRKVFSPGLLMNPGNTISVVWAAGGVSAGGVDADGHVIRFLRMWQ